MALALMVDAAAERAEKVRAAGACAGTTQAAVAINTCCVLVAPKAAANAHHAAARKPHNSSLGYTV
jgi:hypothetical protein